MSDRVEVKSGIYEADDGNDMIVNGTKYPITIPVANWIRDHKYQPGLDVTFEIKEQNGRRVITKVFPTPSKQQATGPDPEKLKQHGFGQPTPSPGEAAANAAKDRAEGAANMAENARYAQELAAGRGKDATHDDAADSLRYTEIPPKKIQPGGIEKIVADTKARNDEAKHDEIQKAVVAHVPQAAVNPVKNYSADEMVLLRNVIAKGCTDPEFKLLMYMASTYGLDPLLKQIWAVKRSENAPALIFAGRDGMLAIAHRSGHFDGMHSEVVYEGTGKDKKPVSAWCEIWRNDMTHSFKVEVPFSEYNTGFSVWKTNPSAMILKVAESVCLRKAFSVSGLYSPEEINTEQGA